MRAMFLLVLLLVMIACGTAKAQMVKWVYLDTIEDLVPYEDQLYLPAGQKVSVPIHIRNSGTPACKFAPAMTFIVESPDEATWDTVVLVEQFLFDHELPVPGNISVKYYFSDLFAWAFYEGFSFDGSGTDTIGFAGIVMHNSLGIFEGFNYHVWYLEFTPSLESAGKTICIDFGGERDDGYNLGWHGNNCGGVQEDCAVATVLPYWEGPFCFEVIDYQAHCCGLRTEGLTGNVDCDIDGLRNMADITRLIDHIYISHEDLCCLKNGNVDGDEQELLNLTDITRLIDLVYVSHGETSICQ